MKTFPPATVGGLNFEKLPSASLVAFCWLFHSSRVTLPASYARRIPGCGAWFASPALDNAAHTIPVPAALPLAESEIMPPGMPVGASLVLCAAAGVWKRPFTRRKTFSGSPAGQRYIAGPYVVLFQKTGDAFMRAAEDAWKL